MTSAEIIHAVETSIAQLSDDDRVVWLRYSAPRKFKFWGGRTVWWDGTDDRLQVTFIPGGAWAIKRFAENPFRVEADYLQKEQQRYRTLGKAIITLLKSSMVAEVVVVSYE